MDRREAELRHWEGQLEAERAGQDGRTEEERAILDEAAQEIERLRGAFAQGEPLMFHAIRDIFARLDDNHESGRPPIA